MAASPGRGASLDQWQRQAVLAAATLLRERFGGVAADPKARAVHDALLEVVEPVRRAVRLQREMASAASGAAFTAQSDRRARGRRRGDRREADAGSPGGADRRARLRRQPAHRRAQR
jgi:hypothetical protein